MVSLLHLTLRCRVPSLQLFALHPTLTPSRMRAIAVVAHNSISIELNARPTTRRVGELFRWPGLKARASWHTQQPSHVWSTVVEAVEVVEVVEVDLD